MRRFAALLLLMCALFPAWAEKTTRILDKDDVLELYPDNPVGKYAAAISPAYPVRAESTATYARAGKSTADIANILAGISTITGTQYYSQTKKAVTTLFTEAYTVNHPRHAEQIPDHHFEEPLPLGIDIYGMLADSRFKDNIYLFSYQFQEDHISLMITNHTTLKYGFLKAVETNCFVFLLDIVLTDDAIAVYNAGFCKPAMLPSFMEKKVNAAITNRMDALFGWFEGEVTKP